MKYNWHLLKHEFTTGNWLSVSQFFSRRGITNNSRNRTNTKGWHEAKTEFEKQVLLQVKEKIVESESEIRLRQQKEAKMMQEVGLTKLKELPVDNIEDARKLIVSGLDEERISLGLGENKITKSQTNANTSRTELDKFIEQATYNQIFEFLSEIKSERKRRSLTSAGGSFKINSQGTEK